ncbi:hypothetical protein BDA96_08G074000 [Sorghum bicolor]|uniref:Uncharacterized protein n=1 Tax=Sorghum bicolor TaxID=4558 RepID=A0A921U7H4_SORBI|nr:hypothetical protein BDA96_08G074000 [Sorghum bicolor]
MGKKAQNVLALILIPFFVYISQAEGAMEPASNITEVVDVESIKTLFQLAYMPEAARVYHTCGQCSCCQGKICTVMACCWEYRCNGNAQVSCVVEAKTCGCANCS